MSYDAEGGSAPGPGYGPGGDEYRQPDPWSAPSGDAPPTAPGFQVPRHPASPAPAVRDAVPGHGPQPGYGPPAGYGPRPGYGPPGYPAPYYGPPMMARKTSGMAVTGMVLGIVSLVFFWVWFASPVIALLGVIFSGVGISQCNRGQDGKGMAVAGLVCSLISLALWALIIIAVVNAFNEV
jgi:hypothetical protein